MSHFQKITATGKAARATAKTHAAVIDQRTGLMWTAKDAGTATFCDAPALIADLNAKAFAGFTDWRLPTLQELFGIADHSRFSPAIDTDAFPSCKGGWYWSSTVYASPPRSTHGASTSAAATPTTSTRSTAGGCGRCGRCRRRRPVSNRPFGHRRHHRATQRADIQRLLRKANRKGATP